MLTSTSPRLLFLPTQMRLCLTKYSNSRPSSLAIGITLDHECLDPLDRSFLSDSRAKASLSFAGEVQAMLEKIFATESVIDRRLKAEQQHEVFI